MEYIMAIEMKKENVKTVADVMNEIYNTPNMECGVEEIIFPDGSREKFYYNGEADKQAAIDFAQICINATEDSYKAKRLMYTCFQLMVKNIHPTEIVELDHIGEAYIDHHKGIIVDAFGETLAELQEDEKRLCDSGVETVKTLMTRLLVERANAKIEERYISINQDWDDEDYDDEDWDDEDYDN